jgi:hypothetical protein
MPLTPKSNKINIEPNLLVVGLLSHGLQLSTLTALASLATASEMETMVT